ncbi:MAG: metallopeptidase family protein [Deltaproteobacteria bacterium]|nr:metallopeptidase family protein [Deltaproteobacteria bacterium]MBI2975029.1 metallopeptidase family protein [Deltaproteobacteria bacterium]
MKRCQFEEVIKKALLELPEEIIGRLENIEITVEDSPKTSSKKSLLLGLYHGVPLEKRGSFYGGVLPDKITLYQKNIEAISKNEAEMVEQIKRTLLHEIGHYFGISERKLRSLGY